MKLYYADQQRGFFVPIRNFSGFVHRKGQESRDHTAYFVYLDSALPISSTHLLDQYAPPTSHRTPSETNSLGA